MKIPYKSRNPKSGVVNYEIVGDSIILEFTKGKRRYVYSDVAPGRAHVETMKRLAAAGRGLSTYVSQHMRENYAGKLPLSDSSRDLKDRQPRS